MKNIFKVILLVIGINLSFIVSVYGTEISETELIDQPHEFTVVPGTQEWEALSQEQRIELCRVSDEEMEMMTTSALISTILEYPYIINIFAYDSIESGMDSLNDSFGGIDILLDRKDALDELEIYLNMVQGNNEGRGTDVIVLKTIIEVISSNNNSLRKDSISTRASNATVYTPNGTAVAAYYNRTWWDALCTEAYAVELSNEYMNVYPTAQIVRTPSPKYNCHSYAWYSTSAENLYWIDDPTAYVTDGSYMTSYAKKENKVTYKNNSTNEIIHSGIVNSTSNGIYVFSKWGNLALFYHEVLDCPYSDGGVTIQYWTR